MKYNLSPHHPKVVQAVLEKIRQMTPEEALAFLKYRTPGIEETDMAGMLTDVQKPQERERTKRQHGALESAVGEIGGDQDGMSTDERKDMAASYTPRQGQFLAFIHAYTRLHRQPPSEMEMAKYFGVTPPSVHQMVVGLQNRGLIQRLPGQARSIRVLVPPRGLPDLESGQAPLRLGPAFEECYPDLARWIMGGGWVELGRTEGFPSMARALDEGGMVWEGKERYRNMDDLLRELNEGIAQWTEENG